MKRLAICLMCAGLLAACEARLKAPSAEISLPKLKLQTGTGFCPPGQAKKGAC
jgi:hypothetical protein